MIITGLEAEVGGDRRAQPAPLEVQERADQRERAHEPGADGDEEQDAGQHEQLDDPPLAREPVGPRLVLRPNPDQEPPRALELGGEDAETEEDDRPTGAGGGQRDDAEDHDRDADDADDGAVGQVGDRVAGDPGAEPLVSGHQPVHGLAEAADLLFLALGAAQIATHLSRARGWNATRCSSRLRAQSTAAARRGTGTAEGRVPPFRRRSPRFALSVPSPYRRSHERDRSSWLTAPSG